MANLHILTKAGADLTVAAHVAVPAGNNSAGTPWRTALTASGIGGRTILADGDGTLGTMSAAEKALILSGALYEAVETIHVTVPVGAAAINAYLDALFAGITSRVLTDLQDRLQFWGYSR